MSFEEPVCSGERLNALIGEIDDFFVAHETANGLAEYDSFWVAFYLCQRHPEYFAAMMREDLEATGYAHGDEEIKAFVDTFVSEHPITAREVK